MTHSTCLGMIPFGSLAAGLASSGTGGGRFVTGARLRHGALSLGEADLNIAVRGVSEGIGV